ncbi:response regulator [Calothrix sp. 336/3]|uniref:response regulator n=1 Tax=Calothrix sp. 336/3 TaxID=1337936 RepID=UPI0004E2C3C4|nr:response regulator [Calothrix sp. 336/3]AKG24756.1 chemotaxis protein CheY [Calothrix sp. 336/3]
MHNYGTFNQLTSLSLLRHLTNSADSTCLQVFGQSVSWSIYLEEGKIIYATHSVEPFDILERHLRRFSQHIPTLTSEVRVQLRLLFELEANQELLSFDDVNHERKIINLSPPEYQAICWLINQKYLQANQAAMLVQEIVKEVLQSFLLVKKGSYELKNGSQLTPVICKLNTNKILERSQQRIIDWQSLAPEINSPYQRPYLRLNSHQDSYSLPGVQPEMTAQMKGFSLRHLGTILQQDELELAKKLYPAIKNGTIVLHEPDPPFDRLPKTYISLKEELTLLPEKKHWDNINTVTFGQIPETSKTFSLPEQYDVLTQEETENHQTILPAGISSLSQETVPSRQIYKIVSVDDSPTILREISRYLEDENFSVVAINDPLKAIMSIIRHKPDMILLDLHMQGIDGYELCRLIRNNSIFRATPILMVTGSKGIIDRVKARLVGASGYLTKPFDRADLLKMVFMHLT